MKWFLLSLSLFCFSSLAQVVCKDPDTVGDARSEATALSAKCNRAMTAAAGDPVDREADVVSVVINVAPAVSSSESSASEGSPSGEDDSGGSQ